MSLSLKPSAFKPRKRNAPRPAEKSAPGFLQWLRGRECLAHDAGPEVWCEGKIEAAHVDYAGDKGMGTKVSDRFAIPLCSKHHRIQHEMGWTSFELTYLKGYVGAGLRAANQYWKAWPGRAKWERENA